MRNNDRFYIPVFTFLTLASVVLLVRFWPYLPADWQSYVCERNRCTVMDWLSATAGWVGFAAAVVAAIIFYRQLYEQQRQTAFMIGDGAPTADIACASWNKFSAGFRVVNWNRRTVVVESIKITSPRIDVRPVYLRRLPGRESIDEDDYTQKFDLKTGIKENGSPKAYPDLPGWEDHSTAPSAAVFFLSSMQAWTHSSLEASPKNLWRSPSRCSPQEIVTPILRL